MNSLIIIFSAIALDAIGIGLVFPILPRLLQALAPGGDTALAVGLVAALYALAQFLFAPVLGALSDRYGRRPILLLSLAGASASYLLMACATDFRLLLLGRAIAGLTSANLAVATAYITDISTEEERAGRFGLLNALFGAGFIVGPVLGGALGDHALRLPFLAAALLNGLNFLLALFALPESHAPSRAPFALQTLNPLRSLRWTVSMKPLRTVAVLFFLFSATGEVYGTCWALWGKDAFNWNGLWIGLSLGAFGICQAVVQATLPGRAVRLMGERGTVLGGLACASLALVVLAFAQRAWMVFAVMPVFALGGIGTPALQAIATRQVGRKEQGQLQGVLSSVMSLAAVVGPLAFATIYGAVRLRWPGAVWLSVIAVHAAVVPIVTGLRPQAPREPEAV
ncbi:TCR/Tet family MFS transporter [Niveibacterium sp. SC-1]|uniref:TCR/Tet family MFS transporter n=1 Tax=Niveibacterium sp. SC-1 TaxID=3135646 RepID=UPI00311F0AE9